MKFLLLALALLGQADFKVEPWPIPSLVTNTSSFREEDWPEIAKSKVSEKPVVTQTTADWCKGEGKPCTLAAEALTPKVVEDLPFSLRVVDVSSIEDYPEDVPTFSWIDAKGKQWNLVGWYGLSHLLKEYSRTTETPLKTPSIASKASSSGLRRFTPSELRAYARSYRGGSVGVVGGNFWAHLQAPNHGFTAQQLLGLTQQECERIHSAHHNGHITPYRIGGR